MDIARLKHMARWLTCIISFGFIAINSYAVDTDSDGVDNAIDNCLLVNNIEQVDSDADGYGNYCDPDVNNDYLVNFIDFAQLSSRFLQTSPYPDAMGYNADFNSDGVINFLDVAIYQRYFLQSPGPGAIDTPADAAAASRFLQQTTFGPRFEELNALTATGDLEGWIDAQMQITPSSHEILTRQYAFAMCFQTPEIELQDGYYRPARMQAWWTIALNGDDQLRQRVAYALSQIFVVGDGSDMLGGAQYGMASYYDMLAGHAFGNFRDLMEDVTKHPVMGIFLSMVRNEPPQPSLNIRPDENYARELLQLFSIGVHELNLDGSKVLDANGVPISTYNQADIENFSRVFTGWNFTGINWFNWFALSDLTEPLVPWAQYHDTDAKQLLYGVTTPAGQTAQQDLTAALDNIFNHPNVGPFISHLLIQRLVTSNPTPGYIERVATVFNNNGSGTRGDLAAVIKAILVDPEARAGHVYLASKFGKLREPILRVSHMRRAFNAVPVIRNEHPWNGTQCDQGPYDHYRTPFGPERFSLAQQPQSSPSVFNFYLADYSPPGPVRASGLVAPEFQLFVASTAQSTAKVIAFEAQNNQIWGPDWVELQMSNVIPLAANPEELLDFYDGFLMSGQMSDDLRANLLGHMTDPSLPTDATRNEVQARDALMLILLSPEYLIQR